MTRHLRRAAMVTVLAALGLGACRNDGRDMQTPRFPPPTPTTSTTTIPVTAVPSG